MVSAIQARAERAGRMGGSIARFLTVGPLARKGFVALLDQGIISGSRFFTTLLVGRIAGPAELGFYSLAVMALILTVVVQESLITTPYTMYSIRMTGAERSTYTGSAFVHHVMLSTIAMIFLATGGLLVRLGGFGSPEVAPVLWILAGIIPFALLREFARRIAFAQLKMGTVFAVDAAAAAIQIGVLLMLAWQGALTAMSAFLTIGLACAAAGVTWLVVARKALAVQLDLVRVAWRRNWAFGRWVCAGQVSSVVHGYVLYWVLALLLGTGGAGIFVAAESIILFSNPLILGLGSLIDPESAHSLASGGQAQLRRMVKRGVLLVGGLMGVFVACLFVFGDVAMSFLYGSEFAGQGLLISVLGVAALLTAGSIPLSSGLKALERPDVNFKAQFVALIVTLVTAVPLVNHWGILGGAVALFVGDVFSVWIKVVMFRRLMVAANVVACPAPVRSA